MTIHQSTLEHPISCSYCEDPANIMFFDKKTPENRGIVIHLRKIDAKCYSCMSIEDNELEEVVD